MGEVGKMSESQYQVQPWTQPLIYFRCRATVCAGD